MNRRSFFAVVGGLALGGALPEQKVEAKPVEFVDAPNMHIVVHKRHGRSPGYQLGSTLTVEAWGDEDAEYRLLARKVS